MKVINLYCTWVLSSYEWDRKTCFPLNVNFIWSDYRRLVNVSWCDDVRTSSCILTVGFILIKFSNKVSLEATFCQSIKVSADIVFWGAWKWLRSECQIIQSDEFAKAKTARTKWQILSTHQDLIKWPNRIRKSMDSRDDKRKRSDTFGEFHGSWNAIFGVSSGTNIVIIVLFGI